MALASIDGIVSDLRNGQMVILVDSEHRENEGDLLIAAQAVTPEAINFMSRYGRGLICLTLTEVRCRHLGLSLMVPHDNKSQYSTAFTVSIEAARGVTTGISAYDRAHTVQTAVAQNSQASDVVQPGHIFPLMAQPGGVLSRAGHTEAGCDLSRMAGFEPAAVICEILNEDGSMARLPELIHFAEQHGIAVGSIADLIAYRSRTESVVEAVGVSRTLLSSLGPLSILRFQECFSKQQHMALSLPTFNPAQAAVVFVYEGPCDVLDCLAVNPAGQPLGLHHFLTCLSQEPNGVLLVLDLASRQKPRDEEAEMKRAILGQMLRHLGVQSFLPGHGRDAAIDWSDFGLKRQKTL